MTDQAVASLGTLATVVLLIFTGAAIPWALRLDRRDANQANQENKSEGTP